MNIIDLLRNNFTLYIVAINIFSFIIFGIDKYKANNKKFRISELFFYIISLLGGAIGIIFGIIIYKHKISKNSFSYKILIFYLVNIITIYLLFNSI